MSPSTDDSGKRRVSLRALLRLLNHRRTGVSRRSATIARAPRQEVIVGIKGHFDKGGRHSQGVVRCSIVSRGSARSHWRYDWDVLPRVIGLGKGRDSSGVRAFVYRYRTALPRR